MQDLKLAIVDIETTGGSSPYDRIIEIGIIRVEENRVVETFSTLINPERSLSPFITDLTGITNEELERAPTFSEVYQKIHELLQGCIFVAHNSRFDYGFIKNELKQMGVGYSAKNLCTVRLSRLLYPKYRRHNLDSVMERCNLTCTNRHRALGDARVVWDFLLHAQKKFSAKKFQKAITSLLKSGSLPPHVPSEIIERLPEGPGVYIFYGEEGSRLYVGKSINIKTRVKSHFMSDHASPKESKLTQQISHIEAIPTSGELGALLLESHLIKTYQPLYNRMSRLSRQLIALTHKMSDEYHSISTDYVTEIDPENLNSVFGVFRSHKQATRYVEERAKEFGLCPMILGLENTANLPAGRQGRCFSSQLGHCKGACIGKDSASDYNIRFLEAFNKRRLKLWPFSSPILIDESEGGESGQAFIVDKWCLIKSFTYTNASTTEFLPGDFKFDYDAYKILSAYLTPKNLKKVTIKPLQPSEMNNMLEYNYEN